MISFPKRAFLALVASFVFFDVLAHLQPSLAPPLAFLSPIQWLTSLAVVMTGQVSVIDGFINAISAENLGTSAALVMNALVSSVIGGILAISAHFIVGQVNAVSQIGSRVFLAIAVPFWGALFLYKPALQHFDSFSEFAATLENLDYEIRLSVGFGILLMAVVLPIFGLLCTKALELVLHPEKTYVD